MDFFTENELSGVFQLKPDVLPTKNDALLYVYTRIQGRNSLRDEVLREMGRKVVKLWEKADCCPFSWQHVVKLFEKEVWSKYSYLKREKKLPGISSTKKRSHRGKKTKKSVSPKRKSARLNASNSATQVSEAEDKSNDEEKKQNKVEIVSKKTHTRSSMTDLRSIWDEIEGKTLFDVKSDKRICKKTALCFDSSFYEDQRGERKLCMLVSKVTKEFEEQERGRKLR